MQFYIHYLDIVALTKFDTALNNRRLRNIFLDVCKQYINIDTYTITEYYQYIYARQIKIINLIVFNNRQLNLLYHNINSIVLNHVHFLSISDCCIDNHLINYILQKMTKLKTFKLGITKFNNCMFDSKNEQKYELNNIYSNPYLDDSFTYMMQMDSDYHINNHLHNFNMYKSLQYENTVLDCHHDEYLIDCVNIIDVDTQIPTGVISPYIPEMMITRYVSPLKYYDLSDIICNIMNNIIGDIGDIGDHCTIEELYIHNTNNLTYANIMPLLQITKLKILSINISTFESILPILQYKIPIIEIINYRLSFDGVMMAIAIFDKKIKKLEVNIEDIKLKNFNHVKVNFILTTHNQKISITFCELRVDNISKFGQIFSYCSEIDELTINTIYVIMIIKKSNIQFHKLNKINILSFIVNSMAKYDEFIGDDMAFVLA